MKYKVSVHGITLLLVKAIRIAVKIFYRNHCRVDSIKKDSVTGEYMIYFMYTGKRQIFIKSIHEVVQNSHLVNEFSPIEAALLGFYQCCSYFERGQIKNDLLNESYK